MMGILAPFANFLMSQTIGTNGGRAGPCFGYYPFKPDQSALAQLQDEVQKCLDAYHDSVPEDLPHDTPPPNYGPQLDLLLAIQTLTDGLIDLDTLARLKKPKQKPEPGARAQVAGKVGTK